MKIFVTVYDGVVFIEARAVDKNKNIGDIFEEISTDESFLGVPYEDFISHGDGEMEIEETE